MLVDYSLLQGASFGTKRSTRISPITKTVLSSTHSSWKSVLLVCLSPTRRKPRPLSRSYMSGRNMLARKPGRRLSHQLVARDQHLSLTARVMDDRYSGACYTPIGQHQALRLLQNPLYIPPSILPHFLAFRRRKLHFLTPTIHHGTNC